MVHIFRDDALGVLGVVTVAFYSFVG
jgi:hypothetical protein